MNVISFARSAGFVLTTALLASCAPRTVEGPADPAGFQLELTLQETNVGPAVSSTLSAQAPWTELAHRSHTGDKAAAWLPGARLAEIFELEPARVGVVPQQVFAIFVLDAAAWDTLRVLPAGAGLVELSRAGGYVALYRTPDANPYAAGTPDAVAWERLRLSAVDARARVTLRVRRGDGSLAEVDTSAAHAAPAVDTSGSPAP
jgi:hypothetical protein